MSQFRIALEQELYNVLSFYGFRHFDAEYGADLMAGLFLGESEPLDAVDTEFLNSFIAAVCA